VAEQMELLLEVVLVDQEKLFQLQCLVLLPLLMVLLDLLLEDGFLEVEEVLLITIQVLHPKMEQVDHSLLVGDLMLVQEMEVLDLLMGILKLVQQILVEELEELLLLPQIRLQKRVDLELLWFAIKFKENIINGIKSN
jgi:hypothetical protein